MYLKMSKETIFLPSYCMWSPFICILFFRLLLYSLPCPYAIKMFVSTEAIQMMVMIAKGTGTVCCGPRKNNYQRNNIENRDELHYVD